MADSFAVSERTRMRRRAKRATYDRATIYAILDEALIASVATVIDDRPELQPMIHVRIGERIILHGLAGNRMLSAIAGGGEVCLNVTHLDALALARRIEDHSMLYRSATIYGRGREVTDPAEKQGLMEQVFASLVRGGRLASLPPLEPGYLGGTMVVAVSVEEAVGKVNDSVETAEGPVGIWSGLLPLRTQYGPPVADRRTDDDRITPPAEIVEYRRA